MHNYLKKNSNPHGIVFRLIFTRTICIIHISLQKLDFLLYFLDLFASMLIRWFNSFEGNNNKKIEMVAKVDLVIGCLYKIINTSINAKYDVK